jgi:hypothetical protein
MNSPFPIPDIGHLIQEGRLNRAQRLVEYGPLGIGKTWLATQFPNPVLFDTEDGSLQYNVKRIRALNSDDFFNALSALTKVQKPEFKTLVVDMIDQAEKYMRDRILRIHRRDGLEDFGTGKDGPFSGKNSRGSSLNLISLLLAGSMLSSSVIRPSNATNRH